MKLLRYLLFPFSLLYGCITWIRNLLFDWGIKKEHTIPFPSICVGNLAVGGTGKTPHVLLINQWLAAENDMFIVSRGYGRKTKGLVVADENSTVDTLGDEPMLFHQASPKPAVIVAEKRWEAIQYIATKKHDRAVVLLDDAYQHRYVKAGKTILLTDFHSPFFSDFVLPTGNLREFKSGEKRADIVIITKCPETISDEQKRKFQKHISVTKENLFYSRIKYGTLSPLNGASLTNTVKNIVLVTGIANPEPLKKHLEKVYTLKTVIFKDHHDYRQEDIDFIHKIFGKFAPEDTIILTTEKDAMRLRPFEQEGKLENFPWFVQKMTVEIENEKKLKDKIEAYVRAV